MIHTHRQTMGMPTAAMPLLRMHSQTTTLDSLNRISRPPSCDIAEAAVEERRATSSALDVVLQIASLSPTSYSSLARWTIQKPSCEVEEIKKSGDELKLQPSKSRLRQLVERVGSFVALIPPIAFAIYLVLEECRKVKELQDQCIAIEQNAIWRDTWSTIRRICERGAHYIQDHQRYDDPLIDKQQNCDQSLNLHWQTCREVLECAKERCKLPEELYRKEYFRPALIHRLKWLKEHCPSA